MKRRKRTRERQEKREDRQPILKKVRAGLLQSFRAQHDEKIVCARGVPVVTGTLGKANKRPNPNGVEAAVDWCSVCSACRYNQLLLFGNSHCTSISL